MTWRFAVVAWAIGIGAVHAQGPRIDSAGQPLPVGAIARIGAAVIDVHPQLLDLEPIDLGSNIYHRSCFAPPRLCLCASRPTEAPFPIRIENPLKAAANNLSVRV